MTQHVTVEFLNGDGKYQTKTYDCPSQVALLLSCTIGTIKKDANISITSSDFGALAYSMHPRRFTGLASRHTPTIMSIVDGNNYHAQHYMQIAGVVGAGLVFAASIILSTLAKASPPIPASQTTEEAEPAKAGKKKAAKAAEKKAAKPAKAAEEKEKAKAEPEKQAAETKTEKKKAEPEKQAAETKTEKKKAEPETKKQQKKKKAESAEAAVTAEEAGAAAEEKETAESAEAAVTAEADEYFRKHLNVTAQIVADRADTVVRAIIAHACMSADMQDALTQVEWSDYVEQTLQGSLLPCTNISRAYKNIFIGKK